MASNKNSHMATNNDSGLKKSARNTIAPKTESTDQPKSTAKDIGSPLTLLP